MVVQTNPAVPDYGSVESSRSSKEAGTVSGSGVAEAHFTLGIVYLLEDENSERAVEHLEKAVAMDRQNAEYNFRLGQAYAAEFPNANMFRKPFIARRVKDQYELAVRFDPNNTAYREALIEYLTLAPAVLGGSYAAARRHADVLRTIDRYTGLLAHAGILAEEGDVARAESMYRQAIRLYPDRWQAYHRIGVFYMNVRQVDEAITSFKRHVELSPDTSLGYEHLGSAYVRKRMYDEAIAAYQRAFERNPRQTPLLFRIAQLYEFKGSLRESVRYYQQYLNVASPGPSADAARKRISDFLGR